MGGREEAHAGTSGREGGQQQVREKQGSGILPAAPASMASSAFPGGPLASPAAKAEEFAGLFGDIKAAGAGAGARVAQGNLSGLPFGVRADVSNFASMNFSRNPFARSQLLFCYVSAIFCSVRVV